VKLDMEKVRMIKSQLPISEMKAVRFSKLGGYALILAGSIMVFFPPAFPIGIGAYVLGYATVFISDVVDRQIIQKRND